MEDAVFETPSPSDSDTLALAGKIGTQTGVIFTSPSSLVEEGHRSPMLP